MSTTIEQTFNGRTMTTTIENGCSCDCGPLIAMLLIVALLALLVALLRR